MFLIGGLAQMARALDLHSRGRGFEFHIFHMAQKRTDEFKVRALRLHLKEGLNPKEAFAKACEEHSTTPSGCMTDFSTSYMWDYKVWLKQKVEQNDPKIMDLLNKAELI